MVLRGLAVVLLLALDLLLWSAPRAPDGVQLLPLPPALTRLAATGGRSLGPPLPQAPPGAGLQLVEVVLAQGPPGPATLRQGLDRARGQRAELERARVEGQALRWLLQQDAAAMASVLGPDRVAWAAANTPRLATVGEDRAWEQAAAALAAPPPETP